MFLDPFIDYLDATLDFGKWVVQRTHPNGGVIDNFIFFLHYKVSVALFFVASLLVTTGLYIADPIECISDSPWIDEVIDSYCWVYSTFTISAHRNATNKDDALAAHPGVKTQSESSSLQYHNYYQWICYILAFQAILFFIPRLLWKSWEGGKMAMLLKWVKENDMEDEDWGWRESNLQNSRFIQYFTDNLGKHGPYFMKLFFCETLNLMIVLGQMYLSTLTNFTFADVVHYVSESDYLERDNRIDQIFPKVTKCSFNTVGPSGSIVTHDVLCVLRNNVVNFFIYFGMWVWLVILATLSSIMLIYRVFLLVPTFRIMILKHSTKYTDISSFAIFCDKLSIGDWLILRNLSKNLDLCQFTDLVKCLQRQLSPVRDPIEDPIED